MAVVKALYWESSACVRVDGELSEFSKRSLVETKMRHVSPWLFNIRAYKKASSIVSTKTLG